ncbi:MAG: MFS transporter [Roseibium sp.]|nr:MFS transporter [Roseibium sp.]
MRFQIGDVNAVAGALFACHFFGFGLFLPFFPLVLEDRGLSLAEVGYVLGVATAIRIAASPVMANLSDRSGRRRLSVFVYSLGGCLCLALFMVSSGFWSAVLAVSGLMVFWAPIVPLSDAYALEVVRRHGGDYGRMRLWGSVAFVVANLFGGWAALSGATEMLLAAITASTLATGLVAVLLPSMGSGRSELTGPAISGVPVFREPWFWLFLLVAGLLQATHAAFYGFGTLYWTSIGQDTLSIGVYWSVGVAAEICLFLVAGRLGPWFSPTRLMALAAIAGILRWALFPFAVTPPTIVGLQLLHGLSFGAAHLGAVAVLSQIIPARWGGTGQGLLSTSSGLLMAAGLALCGPLYTADPAWAFWAMAVSSSCAAGMLLLIRPVLAARLLKSPLTASP